MNCAHAAVISDRPSALRRGSEREASTLLSRRADGRSAPVGDDMESLYAVVRSEQVESDGMNIYSEYSAGM